MFAPEPAPLTDAEFARVRALAMQLAGISLPPSKKALVVSRWSKRLVHHGFRTFAEYLDHIADARESAELQISLDLLTTNETYFFREPQHFEFLKKRVLPGVGPGERFRVWSAASSTGEEAYSVAMLLAAELRHRNWEVLGTDISSRVLETARRALYDMARTEGIPREYLQRYCMKGTGPYAGKLLIEQALRDHVQFAQLNLNEALPAVGQFDVILLRNVMIYFDADTKARVVERLLPCLKAGGHFLIGHCDSLQGMTHDLKPLQTAVFRKSAT